MAAFAAADAATDAAANANAAAVRRNQKTIGNQKPQFNLEYCGSTVRKLKEFDQLSVCLSVFLSACLSVCLSL